MHRTYATSNTLSTAELERQTFALVLSHVYLQPSAAAMKPSFGGESIATLFLQSTRKPFCSQELHPPHTCQGPSTRLIRVITSKRHFMLRNCLPYYTPFHVRFGTRHYQELRASARCTVLTTSIILWWSFLSNAEGVFTTQGKSFKCQCGKYGIRRNYAGVSCV